MKKNQTRFSLGILTKNLTELIQHLFVSNWNLTFFLTYFLFLQCFNQYNVFSSSYVLFILELFINLIAFYGVFIEEKITKTILLLDLIEMSTSCLFSHSIVQQCTWYYLISVYTATKNQNNTSITANSVVNDITVTLSDKLKRSLNTEFDLFMISGVMTISRLFM